VERVKQLFDKKENRLREESSKAKHQVEQLSTARAGLEAQVQQLQSQLDDAARELNQQQREAAAALSQAATAAQQLAAAQTEAARQRSRVAEVEGEMRQLLEAVESQKAASNAKMRQLASLLQDM
jgi:leucine-rich repeat/coiled-coil domain-containing protein 1